MTNIVMAEMPENYDTNEDVNHSDVVIQQEVLQNIASKNNYFMTINDIVDANKLSPEKLLDLIDSAANDNLFSSTKLSGQEMIDQVNKIREWVDNEQSILKSAPLSMDTYNKKKAILQARAAYVLLYECYVGEELRKIPKKNGTNKNSKSRASGDVKTKAEVIKDKYGLSPRLVRDFQGLTWEGVKAAIEIAIKQNDIPTRALALSKSTKKKVKTNNRNEENKYPKFELDNIEESEHKTLTLEKPLYVTTIFSNISLGLSKAHKLNIHCAVAAEWDIKRALWHELLFPDCHMVKGDFTSDECFKEALEWHHKKSCTIVMASPCCEPFSNLNNSRNKGNVPEAKHFYYTTKFMKESQPYGFIIENVPNFIDARPEIAHDVLKNKDGYIRCIGEYIRDELSEAYYLNIGIYTSADYGCVEDRKRLIILGVRKDRSNGPWKFPKKHSVRKMLWEVIGDLRSLENGEIDPNDPWHYARTLPECVVRFIEQTPTGCSAWDNAEDFQPVLDNGEYPEAKYNKGYTRNDWQYQCPTITTGNGRINDLASIHPGRYNPETKKFTDPRVFSLRELQRIMDCPSDFFDKLNLARDENGMLEQKTETALREAIGQHFCPIHVNALFSTMPLPVNDNNKTNDDIAV